MMLARHDLAWMSAEGWQAARNNLLEVGAHDAAVRLAMIDRWSEAGWPAVVRRRDADAMPDQVCLGITASHRGEGGERIRIALRCLREDIARAERPLELHAASEAVPAQWKAACRKLVAGMAGFDVRVYGSLAWQALTGRPYLTGSSDIDLAFYPAGAAELAAASRVFATSLAALPLDGEVVFPSGRAVAWKEWCRAAEQGGRSRVLVKDSCRVALIPAQALLDEFRESAG